MTGILAAFGLAALLLNLALLFYDTLPRERKREWRRRRGLRRRRLGREPHGHGNLRLGYGWPWRAGSWRATGRGQRAFRLPWPKRA